jgi:hypothetical protein
MRLSEITFRFFFEPIRDWVKKPKIEHIKGIMIEIDFLFFQITIYYYSD